MFSLTIINHIACIEADGGHGQCSGSEERATATGRVSAQLFSLYLSDKRQQACLARFMIAIKFIPPSRGFQVKYSLNLYLSATVKQSIFLHSSLLLIERSILGP